MITVRLNRSPEGGESNGTAVIDEAPETAVLEKETPETQDAEAPKVEKQKLTDWDRYQKMQDKYARDPYAKATKAELELQRKYEGKDESLIAGYNKAKGTQDDEDESPSPTKAKAKEPEDAADIDPDSEIYKLVGAKDKTQLPEKLKGLVNEVKKLSGERGELGRILKDVGVNDLKALQAELKGARGLHQAVLDAKAGNSTALEFLGLNKAQAPQQRQQTQEFNGEIPDDILDEGLYKHVISQAQQAKQEAEELRRELRAIKGKIEPWERSQAETQAQNQRAMQVNHVISEVTKLADGVEGLWDSKKSGPLAKALSEYYATDGDYHPDLKPIAEIIEIAKTHKLDDLEIALAYWERKNGGSLITKARDDARQPFIGKKPNIGLSDRQGNHNGQFKTYTEAHVQEMARGRAPIPASWVDRQGTLIPENIPAHLRKIIITEG
jgi:hypothetical protein